MMKKISMLVAAQIALSATPALAAEPWNNGAPTQTSIAEEPRYEANAPRTHDDADADGDRPYGADPDAAGAASGEPKEDAAARERALEEERERQFVERIWTGP